MKMEALVGEKVLEKTNSTPEQSKPPAVIQVSRNTFMKAPPDHALCTEFDYNFLHQPVNFI